LARRIRALGINDFRTYCAMVTGPNPGEEKEELLSALTTNVSSFYRERHHFEILRKTVLPSLREKAAQGNPIRIWSAGCSAGQEPYSLAATLCEVWPDVGQLDVQILATDVDPRILQKAKTGTYRMTEADGLSQEQVKGLFEPTAKGTETLQIRTAVRELVKIDQLNLVSDWRLGFPSDLIFCRNVVIYFERATQHRLWQRFHDALVPSGHLFIGHSERLSGPAETKFQNIGITSFAKN
jgi:chemotaxis protein methyltransferase CheR